MSYWVYGVINLFPSAEFHWSEYANTALLLTLYALWEQQAGVTGNNRMTGFNNLCSLLTSSHTRAPHSTTPRATTDTVPTASASVQYMWTKMCVCSVFVSVGWMWACTLVLTPEYLH